MPKIRRIAASPATMAFAVGPVSVTLIADGDRIVGSVDEGRGAFEPATLPRWAQLCSGGGTVLDIGAYSGLFAIAAAKLGCHVIAFEPMPFNADRLEANAELNGVTIDLRRQAVSDLVGRTDITFNPAVPFTSGASLVRRSGQRLPVETVTIDSLGLASLRAIKIDVERAEPAVLRGGARTLARCQPALLVEALGPVEIRQVMAAIAGYRRAGVLDGRNLLLRPSP